MTSVTLESSVLDRMLPMTLCFDAEGRVAHVGPTFNKIAPSSIGLPLEEVLRVIHPQDVSDLETLLSRAGHKLRVELLSEASVPEGEDPLVLRAVVAPLAEGGGMLSLSLGADPEIGLTRHRLTACDFTETDPMVDYIFLIEVHNLLLSEFQRLNDRLDVARAAAEQAAVTDKLTGLHNRRAMDAHLSYLTGVEGTMFGLMHLDLDHFKTVNDTLGHAAGDHVLEEVARILREEIRAEDMVARMGGDEFMLVFDNCADMELLQKIGARIIDRLEAPIDWNGHVCRISGSIGVTLSSYYDTLDMEELVSDVDAALYEAKRAGRAQVSIVQRKAAA